MCTSYTEALTVDCEPENDDADFLFSRLAYLQRNWDHDDFYGKQPDTDFDDLVRQTIEFMFT